MIRRTTQIGTGNYNEKTAKLYTDMSLITADPAIGADAAEFFRNISISNLNGSYNSLMVAPNHMKSVIMAYIRSEIEKAKQGRDAQILVKINSLTDREIIDLLSEASQAGVKIQMIIRGICCLLPGIEGYTDNITVTSVVGRFLEHSRATLLRHGRRNEDVYIFGGFHDKESQQACGSRLSCGGSWHKETDNGHPAADAQGQC